MNNMQPQKQRSLALLVILAGGALLILAALALLFQGDSPGTAGESQEEDDLPYPEVARIPLDEARGLLGAEDVVFLDVRSLANFEDAHVPGAISMPTADIQVRFQELSKDQEILTYCT